MNIGYVRVSTSDQSTSRQYADFEKAGIQLDKIYEEKLSGKDMSRPQLEAMLDFVREGDILYVESISRLGRSLKDLFEIVGRLEAKSVQLVSLKESIDTTTPEGRLTFTLFAALAQFERELMKARQREGIETSKAMGKHLGRPQLEVPKNFETEYKKWKAGNMTAVQCYTALGMSKASFYKQVRKYEGR